ncbi:AraC family transcriptional regulator [Falsiroseomonas tokyonensis]|uniref:Helix-turn-helix domain-containing protein n=1 Tax=Falsiroseomonas tokyonensis TaxID=430521 RepID=A0ABV7C277_9PROT|nr:helix-turn-helix domain-containing protein [Falsiroseomonas tokyonensis]MBU8541056.1 AraC family transcriptional regulator [Falsiroseomonas tokyonensis]
MFAFHPRSPHPALRGLVRGLWHYEESREAPQRRREMPCAEAVLLINLGPPIGVAWPDPATKTRFDTAAGFLARPHPAPARSFMGGRQRGVQVMLTPLGAERLLRCPISGVPAQFLDLRETLGLGGPGLAAQLAETTDPDACLDLLEAALLRRLAGDPPADAVAEAWRRIEASAGRIGIGALARDLGLSRQTLVRRFHDRTGLTPKLAARLQRFGAVIARLPEVPEAGWAGLAAEAGFADQSHLIREVRAFTGLAPAALLRRRLTDGLGFGA